MLEAAGWSVVKIFPHRARSIEAASISYLLRDYGFTRAADFGFKCSTRWEVVYGLAPLAHLLAAVRQTGAMTVWARR
jgi:hypothetical protein